MVLPDAVSAEAAPVLTAQSTSIVLGWLDCSRLLAKCNNYHQKHWIIWGGAARQSCPLVALEKGRRQTTQPSNICIYQLSV